MASFLQKRLRCFYCGCRSSRSTKGQVREWKCPECQAVNYLDEKGEITDPPVADAASGTTKAQYALPLSRSESEALLPSSSPSALFCSTCLKNQHLLTQTLASYLPPPSHPEYEAYEASYPAYRKSLEERYPQVCGNCEPRIRERIRQTGYAAKADHLRRMMDRSRSGRFGRNRPSLKWRSLLVSAGAIAFWVSVAGQLACNVVGAMPSELFSSEAEMNTPSLSLFRSCISCALNRSAVPMECKNVMQSYSGFSLTLGALAVWWNPRLRYKVDGRPGRLAGLREYYQIQIVVLVMRFAAWACLQDDLIMEMNPKLAPVIHILVGIFTIISVIASRTAVKFDTTPLVNWQDNIEPLVQNSQPKQAQLASPPASQETGSNTGPSLAKFPISNLAPPRQASPEPQLPLTPPDDTVDDDGAMDWTPSQQTFQPNINTGPLHSQTPAASSIFQGQLPAAPKPLSWQLRNRNSEPAARAVESKSNPFRNAPVLQPTPSFGDDTQRPPEHEEVRMAPPKFFPPSDLGADTGLESLFDRTFSLADEPSEVRKKSRAPSGSHESMAVPSQRTSHMLKCVLLAVTLIMLAATHASSIPRNTVETTVLAACFLIAGFSLLENLMSPMHFWSVMDILLPVLELVACFYLTVLRSRGTYHQLLFDRVGKGLSAFMLGQEMMALRGARRSSAISTAAPASEPQLGQKSHTEPAPTRGAPRAVGTSQQREPSPSQPQSQFGAMNLNSFSSNNNNSPAGGYHAPPSNRNQPPSFSTRNANNHSHAPPPQSYNPSSFQNNHRVGSNSMNNHAQAMPYPPPFSSFSRPPVDPPLSFSSFGSALPDNVLSTASTVSTTEYASSIASDQPSPQPQARQQTPHSAIPDQRIRSPSITGLTLDDSPIRPGASRYSLRNRRR